jgi:hypothetical protein
MKKVLLATLLTALLGLATFANANNLVDNGHGLIWDSDLNITWYDYTYRNPSPGNTTWREVNDWIATLNSSKFAGTDGWRLPSTVDGPYVLGHDGTTTAGYNITTSEMGHLFYTELGNKGEYALDGTHLQAGWGLSDTGAFANLTSGYYWSGTAIVSEPGNEWFFRFDNGSQSYGGLSNWGNFGLAVHDGNISVPEPATIILLSSGFIGLAALRRRFTK